MTFSIVGRSADGSQLGVAVASKFLAIGAYVPAARANVGALATQAFGNLALRDQGLDLLEQGMDPEAMLRQFLARDNKRERRQVGIVDATGHATTYTGTECIPWAGGQTGATEAGTFAAQGNMLAGPQVINAMANAWGAAPVEQSLTQRLIAALAAGQAAGGDPRGKQSAAILVVAKGQGYGGTSDTLVDLRADDAPNPIAELERMYKLHELYFGKTPADQLLTITDDLATEITQALTIAGFTEPDKWRNLYLWMSRENFEDRWHDGKIDPVVLKQLRKNSLTRSR